MYIGWAVNVNKLVLDSSNVTVGEGATVKDALESGGQSKSRLSCASPADKFSVTMAFSFAEESKDSSGLTELDRFWTWYKYQHCYGVNPFQFPAILINSNRQTGNSYEDRGYIAARLNNTQHPQVPYTEADIPDFEYYKITSAVNGSKSGTDLSVNMTWETYATGAFTIPDEESTINSITAHNGYVDVVLTSTPSSEPTTDTWTVYVEDPMHTQTQLTINNCVFDGDVTARLYFDERTQTGTYKVTIGDFSSTFTVE